MTGGVDQCPSGGTLGCLPASVMSDFDDTQYWDGPAWESSGEIPIDPPVRTTGTQRSDRTGRHRIERTRSHHVVTTRPVDDAYDELAGDWTPLDHWVETEERAPRRRLGGVDPRLLRIGAVAAVGVLMIPIALALRDDPAEGLRSEAGAPATTVAPITVATQPLAAPAPTVTVPAPVTAATAPAAAAPAAASGGSASAAAAAAAKPAKPACAGTYTVIANDYWNRFPKSSGVSVAKWLAANNATADTPLYVGDELCIPVGATAPAPPPTTTQPPATTAAPATTQTPATAAAPVVTAAPAPKPTPATTQPPPTTAAPVVTIAPPPTRGAVVPAPALDAASVEAIIGEVWPDDLEDQAIAIATRESRLNPSVRNWCCYGVFAIYFDMGKNFLPQMGITSPEQLFDARTNITAAYKLYTLAGWDPWDL
jgi:LysM repeat protein